MATTFCLQHPKAATQFDLTINWVVLQIWGRSGGGSLKRAISITQGKGQQTDRSQLKAGQLFIKANKSLLKEGALCMTVLARIL